MNWLIHEAARKLRAGGVIAYPTEAVYGLGCDPLDMGAVLRVLTYKQRSIDHGLILVASGLDQLDPYLAMPDKKTKDKLLASWPGPVTWLVPAQSWVPCWLTGQHSTLAVRVSNHPLVQQICEAFDGAIVSTSANPHGHTPARNALSVRHYFGSRLDYILAGEVGKLGSVSEIRDAASNRVVRPANR
jgi:L-threonylcarbamoyladenylate synthase